MNIDKTIQAVNYVLSRYSGKLNYTKLIKILYLADRECLKTINDSITGDVYVSMPYGPVLSTLLDLIKDKCKKSEYQSKWNAFFLKDEFNLISLHKNLPITKLSRCELRILDSIINEYYDTDFGKMIDVVHDKSVCPEWEDPKGTSRPISKSKIYKAFGYSDELIKSIEEREKFYSEEEQLFKSLETA